MNTNGLHEHDVAQTLGSRSAAHLSLHDGDARVCRAKIDADDGSVDFGRVEACLERRRLSKASEQMDDDSV